MIINNVILAYPWLKKVLFVLSFLLLWLYLSNFSSQLNNKEPFNYQAEIFADKAGYYMYMPATYIYGFHADDFPPEVDVKTGNGFRFDTITNKVLTKYTCGISILASPFFLSNHFYQKMIGNPATGFTKSYFKSVNYASVFYLLLGLFFLYLYLKNFFKTQYVIISLMVAFFASNLFFYSIADTFMSHVYSFSMFSIFLWALHNYITDRRVGYFVLLSFICGLIILIRPINILFLILSLFLNIQSFIQLKERFVILIKPMNIVIISLIVFFVLLPQMIYYKYISGSFFYYSYTNEEFTNLFSPKFLEVLFSPNNGIILYTPIYLLILIGSVYQIVKRDYNGIVVFVSIFLMLYISASWWCWYWGCSFSNRPMVDILPILIFSLTAFIKWVFEQKSKVVFLLLTLIVSYLSYANVRFSQKYSHCFLGSDWDWVEYHQMMKVADVFPFNTSAYQAVFLDRLKEEVRILTSDNTFLCSKENGGIVKNKNHAYPEETEKFYLLKVEEDKIVLANYKGKYICSDINYGGLCIADRDYASFWEKIGINYLSDGMIAFNNSQGYFYGFDRLDTLNQLIANKSSIDSATHFRFVK